MQLTLLNAQNNMASNATKRNGGLNQILKRYCILTQGELLYYDIRNVIES
jgi:hypothetical protein